MSNLAAGYLDAGRLAEALSLFEKVLKIQKAKLEPNHPSTLATMSDRALVHLAAGRLNEAVPLLEETLMLQKAKLGSEHPQTLASMYNLAVAYHAAGKVDRAQPLLEKTFRLQKAKLGSEHPQTLGSMAELGRFMLKAGNFTCAEPLLRECLATREKNQPDEWTTFNAKSLLGGCLLGQMKYADAEPLLLAGYEGMRQCAAKIPLAGKPHQTEGLERIVQLYDAWGKKGQADEWRKKLAALRAAEKKPEKPNEK